MSPRLVQNFSGSRAIVCAGECSSIEPLVRTLANLGLSVERRGLTERPIADEAPSLNPDRDILFLDGDTDVSATWPGPLLGLLPPVPVIALVGHEAPSRLKALMQCGATAFLRKPVHGAGVYSALFVGVNEHRHRRDLEARLSEHESRRRGRRALIKAIVQLSARRAWTMRRPTTFSARRACDLARASRRSARHWSGSGNAGKRSLSARRLMGAGAPKIDLTGS